MADPKFWFDVTIEVRDKGVADKADTIDADIVVKDISAKDGHHAAALAMQRLDKRWGMQAWSMDPGIPAIRSVSAVNKGPVT